MSVPPPSWPVYGVNNQCVHNEVIALTQRMIIPLQGEATPQLRAALQLLPVAHPRVRRGEELLEMFNSNRRKRYRRLLGKDYLDWSPKIKAFTKMERIPIVKRGVVKAPRLIQARHPEYNFLLASYTKPLEHWLYNWSMNGWRVIAKGLNLCQRAQLLWDVWHGMKDPLCLSLDCTDWDGHVGTHLLALEHEYYQACYRGNPQLELLLKKQLHNKGSTLTGVSYSCVGGRASGDMNTALGNCVLAASLALCAVNTAVPAAIAQRQAHVICDGDDTIVIAERRVIERVLVTAPEIYAQAGHVLRVDGLASEVWQIEFCQHKPFRRSDGILVMAPNPRKVLQTSFMATGHRAFSAEYFGTLWDQRARVHTGVPCYAELFRRLAIANPKRLSGDYFFGFEQANPRLPPCEITSAERSLFAYQWDISPEEQLAWESACVAFRPDLNFGEPAQWGT